MKSRFRLVGCAAVIAAGGVLCLGPGCITGGHKAADVAIAAPAADAEWHSLVKSGRGCFQRNDFKGALPLFAAAAQRSRALDDPQGLAVALLDQSRCLEEMEYASMLAGQDEAATGDSWPISGMKHLADRTWLAMELRAAMEDPRLGAARRGELAVAWVICQLPEDDAVLMEAVPDPAVLPPAARARYFFVRAGRVSSTDEEAARAFLAQIPADAVLPDALRARMELLEASLAATDSERLDHLETAASIFRSAGRPDGVAFALATAGWPDANPERTATDSADGARRADMAVRAAAACQALGYERFALQLLDFAAVAEDSDIRDRADALRAILPGGAEADSEPKGETEP